MPGGTEDGTSMSTHLHNMHSAPESDGGPCRWFFRGQYFDHYHTARGRNPDPIPIAYE